MLRLLSLIIVCLCLQHAMAQTGEFPTYEEFKEQIERELQKYAMPTHLFLPEWFATPKENVYVGCSLSNIETCTYHETAILSAILNYVISNIDFRTSSHVTATETYNEELDSENRVWNFEKKIIFPIDYKVIRLESDGQHTFAAVEVDTIGRKLNYCTVTTTTKWQKIGNQDCLEQKIDVVFLREGRYTINLYVNDEQMHFTLISEKTELSIKADGKPLQNHNVCDDGLVMQDENCYVPVSNTDIGTVFWQATLEELIKANNTYEPQKYKNVRNSVEQDKLCILYKLMK